MENKYWYGLLVFIVLSFIMRRISRGSSNKIDTLSIERNIRLGKELVASGYLDYATPEDKDSLETEIITSFDIYDDEINKYIHIDAESLAEYNFDFFLPRLNEVLDKRGVKIEIELPTDYEQTNDIVVNNGRIKLYTQYDLKHNLIWETAASNFFERVNEILKSKGLNEQFYLLYEGNDLATLLLTNEQYRIIALYYKGNENEIPYLP
ncbi:hypothetical protein AV926_01000 [Myroides marinus]|uniref:Uncharacterized protein n=1 Tax=Myroides marinus TaxID=703342 RepID=A0A163Y4D3_9FLAO|nr:hypothetical protein [Myroides marinus]KZE78876.1 hypothetical protein AV926_01000 [Myroides marinus]